MVLKKALHPYLVAIRVHFREQTTSRIVIDYLKQSKEPALNIGCGHNPLPGWFNTDIEGEFGKKVFYMDATRPFPIPSDSFQYVFTEHMIEHIRMQQAGDMLQECARILKCGGRIRIATPDLNRIISLANETNELGRDYMKWSVDSFLPDIGKYHAGFVINHFLRSWGHQFVYDPETLSFLLERSGFEGIEMFEPSESNDPRLQQLERHGDIIGDRWNRFETFVVEAVKKQITPESPDVLL